MSSRKRYFKKGLSVGGSQAYSATQVLVLFAHVREKRCVVLWNCTVAKTWCALYTYGVYAAVNDRLACLFFRASYITELC